MKLDWEGAHARLRAAQERLDAIDQSVGDFEALLQARSAAIAAARAGPAPEGMVDYVVFTAGERRYAIDATVVDEVVEITALTKLPGVPALYRGLLSHRGIVFPLIDIGPLLGAPAAVESFVRALLFATNDRAVAIGADTVDTLRHAAGATAPCESDPLQAAAVAGAIAGGTVVLDASILLADARLIVDG